MTTYTPVLPVEVSTADAVRAGCWAGRHGLPIPPDLSPEDRELAARWAVAPGKELERLHSDAVLTVAQPTVAAALAEARRREAAQAAKVAQAAQDLEARRAKLAQLIADPTATEYLYSHEVEGCDEAEVERYRALREAREAALRRAKRQAEAVAALALPPLEGGPLSPEAGDAPEVQQAWERRQAAKAEVQAAKEAKEAAEAAALLAAYCAAHPDDAARAKEGHVSADEQVEALEAALAAELGPTPRVSWGAETTREQCECPDDCGGSLSHRHRDGASLSRSQYAALVDLRAKAIAAGCEVSLRTRTHNCDCEESRLVEEETALVRRALPGTRRTLTVEVAL